MIGVVVEVMVMLAVMRGFVVVVLICSGALWWLW